MSEIKYINAAEFRDEGYLQEVNRRFLHPLGLALEIRVGEEGRQIIGGVWDYRDDPEGINFADDADLTTKAAQIDALWESREAARVAGLGYMVQPT